MTFDHQMRGLLLEESILTLLRAAGYRTVTSAGTDPTLTEKGGVLVVAGRGTSHQIDAIADFRIGQAFSNPQRLLVEAKYYSENRPISLSIIRNAVGVLKDVSEYWYRSEKSESASSRFHYQAAIFSASAFTADAQDYAFAHDIYLLPLRESGYFAPILKAIWESVASIEKQSNGQLISEEPKYVRQYVRSTLQEEIGAVEEQVEILPSDFTWLAPLLRAHSQVRQALIGVIGRAFPILLVPRPGLDLRTLNNIEFVELYFEDPGTSAGWSLVRSNDREPLFTFDLPPELFERYSEDGVLSPERAVDLKEDHFREIQSVYTFNQTVRIITFRLDVNWLLTVRETIRRRRVNHQQRWLS
jgi:hypothetical protein